MDVLYFIKEEYEILRVDAKTIVGGDISYAEGDLLRHLLARIELIIRLADDLILPELAERVRRGIEVLATAGDQTSDLSRLIGMGQRTGKLGDAKRKDLCVKLFKHIDFMEQFVLPKFRDEISTQAREDMGLVADDYRADLTSRFSSQQTQVQSAGSLAVR